MCVHHGPAQVPARGARHCLRLIQSLRPRRRAIPGSTRSVRLSASPLRSNLHLPRETCTTYRHVCIINIISSLRSSPLVHRLPWTGIRRCTRRSVPAPTRTFSHAASNVAWSSSRQSAGAQDGHSYIDARAFSQVAPSDSRRPSRRPCAPRNARPAPLPVLPKPFSPVPGRIPLPLKLDVAAPQGFVDCGGLNRTLDNHSDLQVT
jgi:hypothetical protein